MDIVDTNAGGSRLVSITGAFRETVGITSVDVLVTLDPGPWVYGIASCACVRVCMCVVLLYSVQLEARGVLESQRGGLVSWE